ncbi:nitrate reductase associated protein [Pseudanabaena sp. FACHB-2040]|uniref:nitrate reductase associated protein n=1 Tax=Pseudanabaena sp. FACHB-2040 TaxID=2692859 RepID=UPI001683F663|nr:nitrate reductase associated protein [Pseudanabaena sp. FACHB-2040]MBD2258689.1 nitrate reductase associated protein [Pseudanabaena sp. FACHB-2040]
MTSDFFQFEADFVESLRCIPMQVRMKLDTCGVKLKLPHWHQFTQTERQALTQRPCSTAEEAQAYRDYLQDLVTRHTGEPAKELPIDPSPPWLAEDAIPEPVQAKADEVGHPISLAEWEKLLPIQRFALLKLSQSGHENRNFLPAMEEFSLL